MKNTAVNTLGYTGTVTLSRYSRNKKIKIAQVHNAGANPLFNFLSDCLVGNFDTAKESRPAKIMLLNRRDESDSDVNFSQPTYESASGFIQLLTNPEKVYSLSSGIVKYSFIITRDILESTDFNSIGLYPEYATDHSQFAAVCSVSINNNDIAASSVLVVDWELNISNKNSEATNVQ